MKNVIIYHNPRCSKSRQALQILLNNHIALNVIEYLKEPPSEQELINLLKFLNVSPRQLLRKNENFYKTLALDNPEISDTELIKAMIKHPVLIERPIIVSGKKAVIGRPPEKVLEII